VSTIARRRLNRKAAADRRCVAIVIGEYERAFYGNQDASMAPLLEQYGIQLRLPEAGGGEGTPDRKSAANKQPANRMNRLTMGSRRAMSGPRRPPASRTGDDHAT
jgi:hypothetical protein